MDSVHTTCAPWPVLAEELSRIGFSHGPPWGTAELSPRLVISDCAAEFSICAPPEGAWTFSRAARVVSRESGYHTYEHTVDAQAQTSSWHIWKSVAEDTESWLQRASQMEALGDDVAALDIVYDKLDNELSSGRFDECDALLSTLAVDELSVDILLAILTVTFPAHSRLQARHDFFQRVQDTLRQRGEYEGDILSGLEG